MAGAFFLPEALQGFAACTKEKRLEIAWLLFVVASVAVVLTPGQDMILVMSRSISQGATAGVVTAAGVSVGLMLHTLLATLGVGAVVKASALLFTLMKFIGAVYLIYLGISLLRATAGETLLVDAPRRSSTRLFIDGAISNVSNPRIVVFYFAFLPQFIATDSKQASLSWFRSNPVYLRNVYRLCGVTFIGPGARLAFEQRS